MSDNDTGIKKDSENSEKTIQESMDDITSKLNDVIANNNKMIRETKRFKLDDMELTKSIEDTLENHKRDIKHERDMLLKIAGLNAMNEKNMVRKIRDGTIFDDRYDISIKSHVVRNNRMKTIGFNVAIYDKLSGNWEMFTIADYTKEGITNVIMLQAQIKANVIIEAIEDIIEDFDEEKPKKYRKKDRK